MTSEIFIIFFLILLNGVFSMSEIAMISARKSALQSESENGSKNAKRALKLASDPDKFLSSIQIGITLIGILTGIFSGNKIAAGLGDVFCKWGMGQTAALSLAKAIIVLLVTYFSIVLGELVPKRIGMSRAEKVAKAMSGPMTVISKIAYPFVWLLSKSTSAIAKLLGVKENESNVTEDEIISLVQEGAEDGEVSEVEQNIVERVFTLGDLSVSTIMTPRSEIIWLDKTMTGPEIREIIEENIYEEYPVCEDDLDHVVGILNIKDFVKTYGKSEFNLDEIKREAVYFHENMSVYKVLEEMKTKHVSRGLVCDEFGSLCGFISLKDIMEALVGDVHDDDQNEEPYIVPRCGADGKPDISGSNGYLVEGACPIYDFLAYFDLLDDTMEDFEYTTIAGLILNETGHIPSAGEIIEWEGFSFEVVDMDGPRIDKVLVLKIDANATADDSTGRTTGTAATDTNANVSASESDSAENSENANA